MRCLNDDGHAIISHLLGYPGVVVEHLGAHVCEDDTATRKLRPMLAQRGIGKTASTDAGSMPNRFIAINDEAPQSSKTWLTPDRTEMHV